MATKKVQSKRIELLGKKKHRGLTLNLGLDHYADVIGDGAELIDCKIIIHGSARGIIISKSKFTNCLIHAKRKLVNFYWSYSKLIGCTFLGRLEGCVFGNIENTKRIEGSIEDCDFTKATLHLSSFNDCDMTSIKLPRWPCFTVLEPKRNKKKWLALPLPEEICYLQETICETDESAITLHWPTIAKEERIDVSPDAVRQLLAAKKYVIL